MSTDETPLRCPVCEASLVLIEKRYVCAANHSFDVARQGYVNLLQSNKRKSKDPGDSSEMVQCRRRFLAQDHYAPISLALNQQVTHHLSGKQDQLLDVGCGEGYYLQQLMRHCAAEERVPQGVYGLDISKPAIAAAAKAVPEVTWIVGTSASLPFHDASLDVVLCVFSRICAEEFARVLKPEGTLIIAVPGEVHLMSLRALIYDKVVAHQASKHEQAMSPWFVCDTSERVSYNLYLNTTDDILNLLAMTPYYWSISPEKKAALAQLENLDVGIDVNVISMRLK